jgi:plasmid stabilization system protein ParE
MRLVISDQASDDLADIWAHIARDNTNAADAFVGRLHAQCVQLSTEPGLGRPRDELLPGIRSFPIGRYVLFYRVGADTIQIVRVLSAYRDVDALF